MKSVVEKHFDRVAKKYDLGKRKYSYYYENLKDLLISLIPSNKKVLEIGCGTGDLLASLNPRVGYGMDISSKMIEIAKEKYKNKKNLAFSSKFSILKSSILNHHSLDFIFMSDVIEHLEQPVDVFKMIMKLMGGKTVFINTMTNPIWEPLLMFWEKMGLKMEEGPHTRIRNDELRIMLKNAGMRVIKHDYKLLIPVGIPLLTGFVNKYLERPFKKFAFIEYIVAIKSGNP